MSGAELTVTGDSRFLLSGALDFSTVGELLSNGLDQFTGHREVMLDLAGVTRVNSAGLALLLEWMDHARKRGFELHLINVPESLRAIARISDVDAMLIR